MALVPRHLEVLLEGLILKLRHVRPAVKQSCWLRRRWVGIEAHLARVRPGIDLSIKAVSTYFG